MMDFGKFYTSSYLDVNGNMIKPGLSPVSSPTSPQTPKTPNFHRPGKCISSIRSDITLTYRQHLSVLVSRGVENLLLITAEYNPMVYGGNASFCLPYTVENSPASVQIHNCIISCFVENFSYSSHKRFSKPKKTGEWRLHAIRNYAWEPLLSGCKRTNLSLFKRFVFLFRVELAFQSQKGIYSYNDYAVNCCSVQSGLAVLQHFRSLPADNHWLDSGSFGLCNSFWLPIYYPLTPKRITVENPIETHVTIRYFKGQGTQFSHLDSHSIMLYYVSWPYGLLCTSDSFPLYANSPHSTIIQSRTPLLRWFAISDWYSP